MNQIGLKLKENWYANWGDTPMPILIPVSMSLVGTPCVLMSLGQFEITRMWINANPWALVLLMFSLYFLGLFITCGVKWHK